MKAFVYRLALGLMVGANVVGALGQTNDRNAVVAVAVAAAVHDGKPIDPASVDAVAHLLPKKDLFSQQTNALLIDLIGRKGTNNPFLDFVVDLHLRPKVFQATGGSSNDTSLGFEFDYRKAVAHKVFNEESLHPVGLAFDIQAKGDVAFEEEDNPNNFMEAGGGLRLFQGLGGITPRYSESPEAAKKRGIINTELEREAALSGGTVPPSVYKKYTEVMRPQFFYDVQAHGKIETDQQFVNKQYVYGAQVGFVFREWRQDSGWGAFNLFDYPFALIRSALQQDEGFQPSGRTFPSVVVGLDQVDPSENKARLAIDPDDGSYGRLRVEIAFKTPVFKWRDDWLYVSAAYRHFQELGASSAIRAADLDREHYFVVLLDLPYNFNFSYATGRLPLDRKDDDVFALGWTLGF